MPKPNKRQNKRKNVEGGGSKRKEEDLDVLISTAESIEPEAKRPKNNKIKSASLHKKVSFEKEGSADQIVPDSATLAEQERLDREREFHAYYEIKSKFQRENVVDAELLNQKLKDVQLVHKGQPVEWVETLAVLSEKPLISNPNDDLSRELSFYNQALDTLKMAKPLLLAAKVPFVRPDDYFAEMLKTDEHMAKVRKRLLGEQERIKSAEGRRRQRELKTFGKKVQIEKEQEKEKRKKANIESIKKWRKDQKRDKSLNEILNDDSDFNRDKPKGKGGKAFGNKRDREGNPVSSLPVFKPKKFKNPVHKKKAGGGGGGGGRSGSKGKGRRK